MKRKVLNLLPIEEVKMPALTLSDEFAYTADGKDMRKYITVTQNESKDLRIHFNLIDYMDDLVDEINNSQEAAPKAPNLNKQLERALFVENVPDSQNLYLEGDEWLKGYYLNTKFVVIDVDNEDKTIKINGQVPSATITRIGDFVGELNAKPRDEDKKTKVKREANNQLNRFFVNLLSHYLDTEIWNQMKAKKLTWLDYNRSCSNKYLLQLQQVAPAALSILKTRHPLWNTKADKVNEQQKEMLAKPLQEIIGEVYAHANIGALENNPEARKQRIQKIVKWVKSAKPKGASPAKNIILTSFADYLMVTEVDTNFINKSVPEDAWNLCYKVVEKNLDAAARGWRGYNYGGYAWGHLIGANVSESNMPKISIINKILKNPAAALKAIDDFYPEHMDDQFRTKAQRIKSILDEIGDYFMHSTEWREIRDGKKEDLQREPTKTAEEAKKRVEDISFATICKDTSDWHQEVLRQQGEEIKRDATRNLKVFPKPKIERFDMDDFKIEFIPNSRALVEEGHRMSHCVGSYSRQCAAGIYSVYRLLSQDGQGLATVMVDKDYKLVQMYGKRNRPLLKSIHVQMQRAFNMQLKELTEAEKTESKGLA